MIRNYSGKPWYKSKLQLYIERVQRAFNRIIKKNPQEASDTGASHKNALKFWVKSKYTYLASPEYYEKQESELKALLQEYGPWRSALDVGCGDGYFTILLRPFTTEQVTGIDVSPKLIQKAHARLKQSKLNRIKFAVKNIEDIMQAEQYDIVCCCGVLSGFIDEAKFVRTISMLCSLLQPGGFLILKKSLSTNAAQFIFNPLDGYNAVYRNTDQYKKTVELQKMKLLQNIKLWETTEQSTENRLFCYQKK